MVYNVPIYENQFISSFIYSMGVIAGKRGLPVSDSINLFQQTPKDMTIGDLFAKWQGRNFIIEFKRSRDGLNDEIRKPFKKNLIALLHYEKNFEVRKLSEICHFASFGSEENDYGLRLNFIPYARIAKALESKDLIMDDMYTFLEKVLDEKLGVEHNIISRYFQIMHEINSRSGNTSTSGIIVNFSKDGRPNFLRFDNLLVLENTINPEKKWTKIEDYICQCNVITDKLNRKKHFYRGSILFVRILRLKRTGKLQFCL